MKVLAKHLALGCACTAVLGAFALDSKAQTLFEDDFDDRVRDQAVIGNDWTWYEQTFDGDACVGDPVFQVGPFDTPEDDYQQANRNYWTASEAEAGQGDSYFRAGLEVPAWVDDAGNSRLGNMLRVYGNQFNQATTCERVLIFRELPLGGVAPGTYTFSYDIALDRDGAPANGEITAGFVKILRSSNNSFETLLFETRLTKPPHASTPADVSRASVTIDFEVTPELVGELLQVGFYNDLTNDLGQDWGTSAALYDNVKVALQEIGPAHSGSWYNESQNGHGFSIEFANSANGPAAVVYWYTYDNLGNPMYMVGAGTPQGQTLEIDFVAPFGMAYGDFDPQTVERPLGGTAVFEFSDRDNATFSYTPAAFTMNQRGHMQGIDDLPLTKLFGVTADEQFERLD